MLVFGQQCVSSLGGEACGDGLCFFGRNLDKLNTAQSQPKPVMIQGTLLPTWSVTNIVRIDYQNYNLFYKRK